MRQSNGNLLTRPRTSALPASKAAAPPPTAAYGPPPARPAAPGPVIGGAGWADQNGNGEGRAAPGTRPWDVPPVSRRDENSRGLARLSVVEDVCNGVVT